MRKSFIFLFITFFTLPSIFAGPFGLDMGMTLEEVANVCTSEPEYIADDRYYIQPEKSHPLFEGYIAWISDSEGLYYIRGVSREIQTNGYGTEVKDEFSKILSPLERKYGKFKKVNSLADDTIYYEDRNWMDSIAYGARTFGADWVAKETEHDNFGGLISISLGIKTEATYITRKAYIWLEYGFINSINGFNNLDDVL